MNTQTIKGTISNIERTNNSYNGNPNYKFEVITDNGHSIPVSTMNDYMVNYEFGSHLEGKPMALLVKVNRKSNKLLSLED